MTNQTNWTVFDGSDEQIAEMKNCDNGFILMSSDGMHSDWIFFKDDDFSGIDAYNVTAYWLIPYDPLREMKLRHDATGQPVWIRYKAFDKDTGFPMGIRHYVTTTPDWNIPNAEYSFTPWED